jgi:hypothetical protein
LHKPKGSFRPLIARFGLPPLLTMFYATSNIASENT